MNDAATTAPGTPQSVFDGRILLALIAAGLLAFIGFFVLTAYAPEFRSGRDGRAHPMSVSAVGYKGLVDLIGHTGGDAWLAREEADLTGEELVVLTPQPGADAKELEELLDRRGMRTTLIVLPKWETAPHPLRKSWVTSTGLNYPGVSQAVLPSGLEVRVADTEAETGTLRGQSILQGTDLPGPDAARIVQGDKLEPLLVTSKGEAVLARFKDRTTLYILADPDLINNQALADPRRARAALTLIEALSSAEEGVSFDLTLSGFAKGRSFLQLAFEPPFLAFTIAAGIFTLLAALHGLGRFGPAAAEARPISLGKAALVDNAAGLLLLARREHRAGDAYADLVRDMAAHDLGAPASLGGDALDTYLDRIGSADQPRFSVLAGQLRAAGDRSALLRAAQALFRWKKEASQ